MGTLDRPSSGSVTLGGREVSGLPEKKLAEIRNLEIGFIFQLHHLLPQCTIIENVLIPTLPAGGYGRKNSPDTETNDERAKRLLSRVGIDERSLHRPGQISVGECQRAAVVRALINKPGLILADEPTGSLDKTSADNLAELLLELNSEEGCALVVVTHSLEIARRMDRLFSLRNGKLEEKLK
jgi:ABC-type lipoprotein export system ATPase subunit